MGNVYLLLHFFLNFLNKIDNKDNSKLVTESLNKYMY